jgi:hypothetical protein
VMTKFFSILLCIFLLCGPTSAQYSKVELPSVSDSLTGLNIYVQLNKQRDKVSGLGKNVSLSKITIDSNKGTCSFRFIAFDKSVIESKILKGEIQFPLEAAYEFSIQYNRSGKSPNYIKNIMNSLHDVFDSCGNVIIPKP